MFCAFFSTEEEFSLKGVAESLQTSTAIFATIEVGACPLLRIVLQDAHGDVLKVYAPITVEVVVGDNRV